MKPLAVIALPLSLYVAFNVEPVSETDPAADVVTVANC
jgi:hypothetical protein